MSGGYPGSVSRTVCRERSGLDILPLNKRLCRVRELEAIGLECYAAVRIDHLLQLRIPAFLSGAHRPIGPAPPKDSSIVKPLYL